MLSDTGYAVIPGPFDASKLETVTSAIDKAAAAASHEEIKVGSSGSNVRIDGLLAKMPALECLFTHPPVVAAAEELIGSFRLSSFHMRTVLPGAEAQALHQDVRPYCDGWPLLGFIFMMDVFTPENGATRFVPGSQKIETMPAEFLRAHPAQVHACGPVGSMILFNGSVWHGFGANRSAKPRRSVQGSLIPQGASSATDWEKMLPPAEWAQISAGAQAILRGAAASSA